MQNVSWQSGMSWTIRKVGNTGQKINKAEMREEVSLQNKTGSAQQDETQAQCCDIETKHDGWNMNVWMRARTHTHTRNLMQHIDGINAAKESALW